MKTHRNLLLAWFSLALLLPAGASAQFGASSGGNLSSSKDEHTGFFFRGTIGPGYGSASLDLGASDLSIGGVGVAFRLGIGASVAPNLAIYADLGGLGIPGPEATLGGSSATASSDTTMVIAGFGVGLSYYIMPINLYLGGALRALQLSLDSGSGSSSSSDIGFGATLVVGKEFLVGGGWGLGPALELEVGRVPDIGETWSVFSVALTLSATYN